MARRCITHNARGILAISLLMGGAIVAENLAAQEPPKKLTANQVVELLQGGVTPYRVETLARQRGLAFEFTAETEQQLRGAGATEDLLKILRGLAPEPSVLVIEAKPGGATVYVDDEPVGKTSSEGRLRVSRLKAGERRVRFTLDGHKDSEHVVMIAEGETVRLIVTLELGKPMSAAPKETVPTPAKRQLSASFQEPEMVLIPAGEFLMGSEKGEKPEKPVHRVYISEFCMAKFPVTNAEYKQFVDATGYRPPVHWQGVKSEYTLWAGASYPPEIGRQPVINVSWDDAVAYCQWLRRVTSKPYRLPTEAEWEKAARGGLEQKLYPWGDDGPDHTKAWFGRQWIGTQTLRDVDYRVANGYGLYGMAGNVYQWVADWYEDKYYRKSSAHDPQGPSKGTERVMRGGAWQLSAGRCAARQHSDPHMRSVTIGFRVARQ